MKKNIVAALLVLAGAALFVAGDRHGRAHAPAGASAGIRRILYYVDPMNPAHTSNRPGLAPCGMKMEPVYETADAGTAPPAALAPGVAGTVRLRSDQQQTLGIRLGQVKRETLQHETRCVGRVVPDERRVYRLQAGVEGIIRDISEATPGSRVTNGQWLATFSAPNARATLQGLLTAVDVQARQKHTGPDLPGPLAVLNENLRLASERVEALGIASSQIGEICAAREIPSALRIHAPQDGVVLTQDVSPGLKFDKGAPWYQIADLSKVWVLVEMSAHEARQHPPGTAALVFLPGDSSSLPAQVSDALPRVNPATRRLQVRLDVENRGALLQPEMLAEVVLNTEVPEIVTVPQDAVLDTGRGAKVFISLGEGWFEPRPIEVGRRFADRVEVLQGVEPGDEIVTSGNFLLDSESRTRLAAKERRAESRRDPLCCMEALPHRQPR